MFKTQAITPANNDTLASHRSCPSFRDALAIPLTHPDLTPDQIQLAIFGHMPKWVNRLMALRNRLVSVLGFHTDDEGMTMRVQHLDVGDKAGFMTVLYKDEHEIISGSEDKHMAFFLSVSKQNGSAVVSTLVNQKTLIGRIYVNAILPFHWIIARVVIDKAYKEQRL